MTERSYGLDAIVRAEGYQMGTGVPPRQERDNCSEPSDFQVRSIDARRAASLYDERAALTKDRRPLSLGR